MELPLISASVNVQNVQSVVSELKALDKNSVRDLRRELRTGLGSVVAKLQSDIPSTPPITGRDGYPSMGHRGSTKWRGINKPKVMFYPGKSIRGGNNLVLITVTGGKRGLGFDYAELAGIRSRAPKELSKPYVRRGSSKVIRHRVTTQGDLFIEALNRAKPIKGKAGRFAYDSFLKSRPIIVATTEAILDRFADRVNKKFEVNS